MLKKIVYFLLFFLVLNIYADESKIKRSISPIFGYNPTDKFILGGAYFLICGKENSPKYYFSTQLAGTERSDFMLGMEFSRWTSTPYVYELSTSITNFAYNYYGEGNSTKPDDPILVNATSSSNKLGFKYRWDESFSSGMSLDLRTQVKDVNSIKLPNEIDDNETVAGMELNSEYDLRDNKFSTLYGYLAKVSLLYVPDQFSANSKVEDFWQAGIDLRYFEPFFTKHVFATRISGGYSSGDPSYLFRYSLGGTRDLRGYYANRFRGKQYYLTQGEYRLPIIKNINFLLFAEYGDITDSKFNSPKTTYGYGFRFGLPPDYVIKLRFDYGIAKDQQGLSVEFGEVF